MIARPRRLVRLYLAAAWLMPLAVLSQIGLALFGVPLALHGLLGAIVGLLSVLLIRLALVTPTPHSQRTLAVALGVLIGLQPCLIALRLALPPFGALHAVNAFVILGVALALALDADQTQSTSSVQPGSAGSSR